MYTIKSCQKALWRNLTPVNLTLKPLNYLLRAKQKLLVLAFLTLEVAKQVA